jgi:predicted porin
VKEASEGGNCAICVKQNRRVFLRWPWLLVFLSISHTAFAGWDFTPAADPIRNWHVNLKTGAVYDDNFNATQKNRESGLRTADDITFRASVGHERFLMGVQYDYGIDYPREPSAGGVDQTHNVAALVNFTVNPRLSLSVSENFVNSLQPQLVQGPSTAPITILQAGTYMYNNVGGDINFAMAPRWVLSVSGNWDIWRYQVSSVASNNDHEDYSATISTLYMLNPRTTVGLNFQHEENTYSNPGFQNGRNASANTAYLSLTRRLNPQLSASANGGYTIRESEDGSKNTSPSAFASIIYNYAPLSSLTLTMAESLSDATLQATRQYSAQENTSAALHLSHRLTTRLRTLVDLTYVYSTFTSPLAPGLVVNPNEQSFTAHLGLNYAFRDWMSAVVDYNYTRLESSDATLIQPYDRNQIFLGVYLTY